MEGVFVPSTGDWTDVCMRLVTRGSRGSRTFTGGTVISIMRRLSGGLGGLQGPACCPSWSPCHEQHCIQSLPLLVQSYPVPPTVVPNWGQSPRALGPPGCHIPSLSHDGRGHFLSTLASGSTPRGWAGASAPRSLPTPHALGEGDYKGRIAHSLLGGLGPPGAQQSTGGGPLVCPCS